MVLRRFLTGIEGKKGKEGKTNLKKTDTGPNQGPLSLPLDVIIDAGMKPSRAMNERRK